jgi:hypothetical protein
MCEYMPKERDTRQIRVDRKIHHDLKILCAERGVAICDLATKILADFLIKEGVKF